MNTIEKDGITYYLSDDGREYKTRSGAWKRNKKLNSSGGVESTPPSSKPIPIEEDIPSNVDDETPPPSFHESESESESKSEWMDFNLGIEEDTNRS